MLSRSRRIWIQRSLIQLRSRQVRTKTLLRVQPIVVNPMLNQQPNLRR